MTPNADRASLIARREALKARLEQERKLALIQPLLDALNEQDVAYTVQADPAKGTLPTWPVVGNQIDWTSIPGATYVHVESAAERDAAFRSLLSGFATSDEWVDIIPSNGDAPIVRVQSVDLAAVCGPILDGHISLYVAPGDESWLIENIEGRGLWGGRAPSGR